MVYFLDYLERFDCDMCYASGVSFYDLENNCVDKSSNISLVYFVMSDRDWPGRTSAGGAPAPAIVMVILQFLLVEISSNSNWIYLQTFTFVRLVLCSLPRALNNRHDTDR